MAMISCSLLDAIAQIAFAEWEKWIWQWGNYSGKKPLRQF
jgi:hypothetical protein